MKTNSFRIHEATGPQALRFEESELTDPGAREVLLRHTAIGVNFADIYMCSGFIPVPLPSGIGTEACGVVEAVGPEVSGIGPDDRVVYFEGPASANAYSERRLINAATLLRVPDGVSDATAAAGLVRGLTAYFMLYEACPVTEGQTVLVHAAAGGLGSVTCQMASRLGATVIGTVSTRAKEEAAISFGCSHVIRYDNEDVPARVRELTGGAGVSAAFDSVGKDTLHISLDALARRGKLICCGMSSGPAPPLDPMQLGMRGSITYMSYAMPDFASTPEVMQQAFNTLCDFIVNGDLNIEIGQRFPLSEAIPALEALQQRRTIGCTILDCLAPG